MTTSKHPINVFLDLETIPRESHYAEKIRTGIRPPANYTKQDSIDKWMAEQAPLVAQERVGALALHPAYNQIVAIGVAFGEKNPICFCGMDENMLLDSFVAALRAHEVGRHESTWIGHNITAFDLPTLRYALARHDIYCPALPPVRRYGNENVVDTLDYLKGPARDHSGYGLSDLCQVFGIEDPKQGTHGYMIADMVRTGLWSAIEEYCERDVAAVWELYHRTIMHFI